MHTKGKWEFNKDSIIPRKDMSQTDYGVFIRTNNIESPCIALGFTKKETNINAKYICKCVNNHENLVNGIKQAIDDICGRCTVITGAAVCFDCMCIEKYEQLLKDINND